jgi:hypothetical protein
MRRRAGIALLALVGLFLEAASARADEVVVLPMTSAAKRLEIFEGATTFALAQELKKAGIGKVRQAESAGAVHRDTSFIIDGRLVAAGVEAVKLEAQLREAGTGRLVTVVSTAEAAPTALDKLVHDLSRRLVQATRRARRRRGPYRLAKTVVVGTAKRSPPQPVSSLPAQQAPPRVLLFSAGGVAAQGAVAVEPSGTASARDFLARHQISFARSSSATKGIVGNAPEVVRELERSGASFALMLELVDVQFSYSGVLMARGEVRVVVMDRSMQIVADVEASTDTVVGSRGDRHSALIYAVFEQALDVARPQLKGVLGG